MSVWREFQRACEQSNKQSVSYTKFIDLWEQFHPNVVVSKPMTDLCFTCQQNTSKLIRSANLPDREKSECVQIHQEHLKCVQDERELYRNACQEVKNNYEMVQDTIALDQGHEASSVDTTMHYSFDCAQQVQYCAKVMQATIVEYCEKFRYLTLINFKRYIERYIVTAIVLFLGKISGDIVYTWR